MVSRKDDILGRLIVRLVPPRMDYLVLRVNDHRHILLRPEDNVSLSMRDKICMEEIQTNLYNKSGIHLNINGHKVGSGEWRQLNDLCDSTKNQLNVRKGNLVLGRIFIHADEY